MKDIYFDENYGKLYEKMEHGEACIFKCENENGCIINQFIKRKIPKIIDGKEYYDIITPYGYGGPYISWAKNKKEILKDYENKFEKYCKKNNIVAEFIRFHPIYENFKDFKEIYNCQFNRYTLATDIKDFDDPVASEFSKHCKKTIRQILKLGVKYRIIEKPTMEDIETFKKIYYLNMKRKKADEYYFFDSKYFEDIYKYFYDKIVIAESIYNDRVIAAGLYFITDNNIHAHLSGTDTEYLYLSPAYILKYGTAIWAKEKKYNFIHYGGGTSNSLEDPLYLFKCKFAKNTKKEFWIGKKIWNQYVYEQLCSIIGNSINEEYFPAYRKDLK